MFIFSVLASYLAASLIAFGQPSPYLPIPEPAPLTPIDLLYLDLFDKPHEDSDALFMRPDLAVTVDGQDGYELAVLNFDTLTVEDSEAYTGATFVEHSLYPVTNFYSAIDIWADNDGILYILHTSLYAVSGTIYNNEGETRIMSGWVTALDIEGTGPYQNQGIAFESFIPYRRHLDLEKADRSAAILADLPSKSELVDCLLADPGSCEQLAYLCLEDAKTRRDCDLNLCDGITNPAVVVAAGAAGSAGGFVVGTKAGIKRPSWLSFLAPFIGAAGGGVGAAWYAESVIDSNCRNGARIRYNATTRHIANEMVRCESSDDNSFTCPVTPCPG